MQQNFQLKTCLPPFQTIYGINFSYIEKRYFIRKNYSDTDRPITVNEVLKLAFKGTSIEFTELGKQIVLKKQLIND